MTGELKPCPFCGDPAVLDTYYDFYRVRCDYPECPANVKNGDGIWYGTIEHAVQRWNTRAERTCRDANTRFNAWTCSECKCTLLLIFDDYGEPSLSIDGVVDVPHYCPNCGAKVVDC